MEEETLEEAAGKWLNKDGFNEFNHYDTRPSFIQGAKWQQQNSYSEEEVIKIVEKSRETGLTVEYLLLTEQFKKK